MRSIPIALLCVATILILAAGCPSSDDEQDDVSLAPYLYQETFEIEPNPAESGETVSFFFGFDDFDGDVSEALIVVRHKDDDGVVSPVVPESDPLIKGRTHGSVEFELTVIEADQGQYLAYMIDNAGNVSNEITMQFYVNPPLPE
ncbi:MAG: hypothetical protein P9M14_05735 [Candidatus Alcyoniella australis]|nr:hypothetical protein [Candidatus Alcyoniella australis]